MQKYDTVKQYAIRSSSAQLLMRHNTISAHWQIITNIKQLQHLYEHFITQYISTHWYPYVCVYVRTCFGLPLDTFSTRTACLPDARKGVLAAPPCAHTHTPPLEWSGSGSGSGREGASERGNEKIEKLEWLGRSKWRVG